MPKSTEKNEKVREILTKILCLEDLKLKKRND